MGCQHFAVPGRYQIFTLKKAGSPLARSPAGAELRFEGFSGDCEGARVQFCRPECSERPALARHRHPGAKRIRAG
jgi:hypothetical protein